MSISPEHALVLSVMRRPDPHEARARELAVAAGLDPDARIERPGQRSMPTWCAFRDAARAEHVARVISFGVGRSNEERVEHDLFDDAVAWRASDMEAYRRLPEVLAEHAGSIRVLHRLRPFAVAMAGAGEFDPFKD